MKNSTILEACKSKGVRHAIDIFKDLKQSKNFAEVCSQLLSAAVIFDRVDIIQVLLNEGVDVNHEDEFGNTCLFNALLRREMLNFLIDNGADISHKNYAGDQPIFGILEWGSDEVAMEFLKRGASVNEPGKDHKIALHHAGGVYDKKILKRLIMKTTDLKHKSVLGETALFNAVLYQNVNLVKFLIKAGADTSVRNNREVSAWDIAVICRADKCKEVLDDL